MKPRLLVFWLASISCGLLCAAAVSSPVSPVSPWPKPLGGPDREYATAVALDDRNDTFVGGGIDAGSTHGFVDKLDGEANVAWTAVFGGPGTSEVRGLAATPEGDLFVTGVFSGSIDFDPGPGRSELASAGGTDAFLLRLNPQGELVWARRFGGPKDDAGQSVAWAAGSLWIAGSFRDTADLSGQKLTSAGGRDAFVAHLSPDGQLLWARRIGGAKDDEGRGAAPGADGEVWVAGNFQEAPSVGPEGGGLDFRSAGHLDVFLLRLDAAGKLLWSGRLGGERDDVCEGVAATIAGGAAVVGEFSGTADLDPGPAVLSAASRGGSDAFLTRVDRSGRLVWSRQLGETGADTGLAVAGDAHGSVYATGSLDRGRQSLTWAAEYSDSGERTWSVGLEADGGLHGTAIAAGAQGVPTVAGWFKGETKELRETGSARRKAAGKSDAFVWRLLAARR